MNGIENINKCKNKFVTILFQEFPRPSESKGILYPPYVDLTTIKTGNTKDSSIDSACSVSNEYLPVFIGKLYPIKSDTAT